MPFSRSFVHATSFLQDTQEKRLREEQTITTTNRTQDNQQQDDVRREYYSEKRYNRTERESRRRSPSEVSDVSATHGVVDEEFKKKYLRCLAYMKLIERLYENQVDSDEDFDGKYRRTSRRVCPPICLFSFIFILCFPCMLSLFSCTNIICLLIMILKRNIWNKHFICMCFLSLFI